MEERGYVVIVLNLIITGIPSIQLVIMYKTFANYSFKPYYNWNTFNTIKYGPNDNEIMSFKPYYNWNTFNT